MARGSVETLASGFRARVYAGKDPITGKQTYLRGTARRDRGEAEKDCTRLLAQVDADTTPEWSATLGSLLDRWAEVVDHELNTAATTEVYVRRVLRPALGDVPLRKLQYRVDMIDRLYTHLRRCSSFCDGRPYVEHKRDHAHDCAAMKCKDHVCRPMAATTIRRVHAILSGALSYAVSWGWIEKNPAESAHPPKLNRRRARPPEAEEVARLLNSAWDTDIELAMFLWLATTTGARRGELTALRWSAVDLRLGSISIGSSYVVRSGQAQVKSTKTDLERRLSLDQLSTQMLTDFLTQRTAALAPAGLTLPKDSFVFSPDPVGLRPWNPDHFTHAYREVANPLGILQPLKNLRHFNATQLLSAGVDLATTAGRLGHTDGGATTLRVYASWMPATDRAAVEQLSADITALRSENGSRSPRDSAVKFPALRRARRPLSDYLAPPADGRTTYRDVASALEQACRQGHLQPGDLMPTVTDLAAWYGLARSTAQRAVSRLGAEGVAERRGPVWVVAEVPPTAATA